MKSNNVKQSFSFLVLCAIVLGMGFIFSHRQLSINIELIDTLIVKGALETTTSSGDVIGTSNRVEEVYQFFYATYGGLSLSALFFAWTLARRIYPRIEVDNPTNFDDDNPSIHLRFLFLSTLTLIVTGYCLQIGLIDPIHNAPRSYGQPYIYNFNFDNLNPFEWMQLIRNPFIVPTIALLFGNLVFNLLFILLYAKKSNKNGSNSGFRGLEQRLSDQWWDGSFPPKNVFIYTHNKKLYKWISMLGGIGFGLLLLVSSVFHGGYTLVEIPKVVLIVGVAGYLTQLNNIRLSNPEEYHKAQKYTQSLISRIPLIAGWVKNSSDPLKWYRGLITIGLILVVLGVTGLLFWMLNDVGATFIVLFALLMINISLVFQKHAWQVGLGIYSLVWLSKKVLPTDIGTKRERLGDWILNDYFVTSGIGDGYITGTASSPDFARALWGLASGGTMGRGTGLFTQTGNDGVYAASMAFGYNDRSAAAILETHGIIGMIFVMFCYGILIKSALSLSKIQNKRNISGVGIALGFAALIFAQASVHLGGNFGFVPFTGVVLPFISHSGMALCISLLLISGICAFYAPIVGKPRQHTHDISDAMSGITRLIVVTFLILLGHISLLSVWQGPSFSTRIRYDIQSDRSVKKVENPRLYLLTDTLNASGQIEDTLGMKVKDSKGEYLLEGMDETDYFLKTFEDRHRFTLKGLNQTNIDNAAYFNQVCALNDGMYHQFAGMSREEAYQNREQNKLRYADIAFETAPFDCSVVKVQRGIPWTKKQIGAVGGDAVNGYQCIVNDTPHTHTPKTSVYFFDADNTQKAIQFLAGTGPAPQVLDLENADNIPAGCAIVEWILDTEERVGLRDGEACVVEHEDDGIKYSTNQITDRALGKRSARAVDIQFDGNRCTASIQRIGCDVGTGTWIDQHAPDNSAKLAKVEVLYGTNRSANFSDTSCTVALHQLGVVKQQSQGIPYFYKRNLQKLSTAYDKSVVDLHTFVGADLETQEAYKKQLETVVGKQVVQIGLHASLQSKVRTTIEAHRKNLRAPSVQALVFDVQTGHILAQAQATQVRSDMTKYLESSPPNISSLYTDKGMYGFGRNNLSSAMVPASTFKILHALAAIEGNVTDVTHVCDPEGYIPDETWTKPIADYGKRKGWPSHNKTPKKATTLAKAIEVSCNQYFAHLAYEHTHPEALQTLCSQKGIRFGLQGACALKPEKTRGAASNGWGQELVMNVYQLANVLIAASTNSVPYLEDSQAYMTPDERALPATVEALFNAEGKAEISTHVLAGMRRQYQAANMSTDEITVYGKTGTGDHDIAVNTYETEKISPFITKKPGKNLWIEDYEAPYGVTKTSNMAIFFALVEKNAEHKTEQVHNKRLGIIVRVPRTETAPKVLNISSITGGQVAAPIVKDLIGHILDEKLLPE